MPTMPRACWLLVGLGATALSGCVVPQERYNEAVARLQQERAAVRNAEQQTASLRERLKQAEALLNARDRELNNREHDLARSQVDVERETVARNDAAMIVDQLRGELARAGDHLRYFADQKKELESALEDARERADEVTRAERDFQVGALIVRDLSLSLDDAVRDKLVTIDVDGAHTVVRLPAAAVFAGQGPAIEKKGRDLLERIAKAIAHREPSRVEVTLYPATDDYRPENVVVQLQGVAEVFNAAGVAFQRVTLSLPPEKDKVDGAPAAAAPHKKSAPGTLELSIRAGDAAALKETPHTGS